MVRAKCELMNIHQKLKHKKTSTNVKTRSNSGAVTTAATIPHNNSVAPISPAWWSEYPCGACEAKFTHSMNE
jgi:hypothetical protein